jgi:hypothetical protein
MMMTNFRNIFFKKYSIEVIVWKESFILKNLVSVPDFLFNRRV